MRDPVARALPLVFSTVLVAVSSILLIPAIASAGGERGWTAVALGQAAGGFLAAAIGYGWALTGPSDVAHADAFDRHATIVDAVRVRSALVLPMAGVLAIFAFLVAREQLLLVLLGGLSIGLSGLSLAWYYFGTGQTWKVLWLDGVPRALTNIVAAFVVQVTQNVAIGLGLVIVGALIASVLGTVVALTELRADGQYRDKYSARPSILALLREHRHAASTSVSGAIAVAAPMIIVGALGFFGAAQFALSDKLVRQGQTAFTPAINALQGWVPGGGPKLVRLRMRQALVFGVVAAAVSIIGFAAIGIPIMTWLGGGAISVDLSLSLVTGLLIGLSLFEMVTSRCVAVPIGAIRQLNRLTWAGTLVGLGALVAFGWSFGATGALLGLCLGQIVKVMGVVWLFARSDFGRQGPAPRIAGGD